MKKLKQLTDTERAYIAGFIDGDGCINAQIVFRSDYRLLFQIRLSVTFYQHKRRKWLLLKLQKMIGQGTLRTRPDNICEYTLVGPEIVKNLLSILKPFIRGKNRQLTLSLIIIHRLSRNQTRKEFFHLCKITDHFGFLNDSKKRTITKEVVEKTWEFFDEKIRKNQSTLD